MIKDVIDRWHERKDNLRTAIAQTRKEDIDYKKLVELIAIHIIGIYPNDLKLQETATNDYQGYNGYMFCDSRNCYSPDGFYTTYAGYGSCSGCDALLAIKDYEEGLPSEHQTDQMLKLCLELVENIKRPYDYRVKEMEG